MIHRYPMGIYPRTLWITFDATPEELNLQFPTGDTCEKPFVALDKCDDARVDTVCDIANKGGFLIRFDGIKSARMGGGLCRRCTCKSGGNKMKRIIKEYWELLLTLIVVIGCIMFMCCGCKGAKEIEHVYHHDTVYQNSVVHDSIDRWHTHYEYLRGDTLHVIDTFYRDRWHIAHDTAYKTVVDVQTREVEKVVEKKVYVWWPLWVALGLIGGLVLVVIFWNWWCNRQDKKEGEE